MEYTPTFRDSLYADIQPSYSDSLAHHGIKGQKWGVRRYQNADGSLTDEGRKRYYRDDARLSKEGQTFNKKARTNFRSYRDATLYNTRAVNPDFSRAEKRYKELQKANSEQYKKDLDAFLKGEDFVGLYYEEFRNKASDRWQKTDFGKEQEQIEQDLRRMLDDSAKEHPLYNKSFKELRDFNPNVYNKVHNVPMSEAVNDFETIDYGRQVVNEIMSAIKADRADNMWD